MSARTGNLAEKYSLPPAVHTPHCFAIRPPLPPGAQGRSPAPARPAVARRPATLLRRRAGRARAAVRARGGRQHTSPTRCPATRRDAPGARARPLDDPEGPAGAPEGPQPGRGSSPAHPGPTARNRDAVGPESASGAQPSLGARQGLAECALRPSQLHLVELVAPSITALAIIRGGPPIAGKGRQGRHVFLLGFLGGVGGL